MIANSHTHSKVKHQFIRVLRHRLTHFFTKTTLNLDKKQDLFAISKQLLADHLMKPHFIDLIRAEKGKLMEIMLTKDKDKMKWDRQEETKVIRMKIKHLMEKVIMEQHKNRKKKNEIIDIDSDDGVEIVEVQVNRSGSQNTGVGEIRDVREVSRVREKGAEQLDVGIEDGKVVVKSITKHDKMKQYEKYKWKMAKNTQNIDQSNQPVSRFQSAKTTLSRSHLQPLPSQALPKPPHLEQQPVVVTDPYIKATECGHFIQGDSVSKIIDHYSIQNNQDYLLLIQWQKRRSGVTPEPSLLPLSEWKYYKPVEASTYVNLADLTLSPKEDQSRRQSRRIRRK